LHQLFGRIHLGDISLLEDENPVVVQDGVETVCDSDNGASIKLRPDGRLDEVVSFQIDGCCGFIQDENLCLPEESSGQADQLSLAHGEVLAALSDLVFQPGLEAGDEL